MPSVSHTDAVRTGCIRDPSTIKSRETTLKRPEHGSAEALATTHEKHKLRERLFRSSLTHANASLLPCSEFDGLPAPLVRHQCLASSHHCGRLSAGNEQLPENTGGIRHRKTWLSFVV